MQIFKDKNGKISSKRVFGPMLLVAALAFMYLGKGDVDNINMLIIGGCAAIGIGVFEKREG